MCQVHVTSVANALCGSHAFQTQLSGLYSTEMCTLLEIPGSGESPDRHSLLATIILLSHSSAINASKYSRIPTAKNPEN
jgi:hypothetical protein